MVLIPTVKKEKKTTFFQELVRKVQQQAEQEARNRKEREEEEREYQEAMKIEASIPKKGMQLVPCIPLQDNEVVDVDKTSLVTFQLKIRPNGSNDSTYKKAVRRFSEGSPNVWIRTLEDIREIWKQNRVQGGSDRAATVRTILRDDALTVFEAAMETQEPEEEGQTAAAAVTVEKVEQALKAVSESVFPHRALENQKLWMRRHMKKPAGMSYRILQSKVLKMNRSLELFPDATTESKFTNAEILEILEFSLPASWRAKFDLDSYVPTKHDRKKLMLECEAIERSEKLDVVVTKNNGKAKEKKKENKGQKDKQKGSKSLKFCSEHGLNSSHDSAKCWSLNPKLKPAKFAKKDEKGKEVNAMLENTSKEELLNMILHSQTTKTKTKGSKTKATKARKRKITTDTESSDDSIQLMDDSPLPSEDETTPLPSEDEEKPKKKKQRLQKLGQAED